MNDKIDSTVEAWEARELGASEEHVAVSSLAPESLDESLELQMISIRMQKSLLDKLKFIANKNGVGYQPLMKQILTRFADSEMRIIMRDLIAEQEKQAAEEAVNDPKKGEQVAVA